MDGTAAYGEMLREAIVRAETSRRKLSFALAEKTENKQESEYRALGKYLSGDEIPDPERAAILAVELGEPHLALVTPVADRRRGRREELEAWVADLDRRLALVDAAIPPAAEEPASGALAQTAEAGRRLEAGRKRSPQRKTGSDRAK